MPNFYSPYQYPQQYPQQPSQQYPQQYPQYGYQQPVQQPVQQQVQPTQQMQNGGFLSAPNEDFVRNYPVGLGNCVTFKIEGKPIVMEKSMGFSQLESPKLERYRLVKEEADTPSNLPEKEDSDNKAMNDAIDGVISEIEAIKEDIKTIKERLKSIKPIKKLVKEEEDDE